MEMTRSQVNIDKVGTMVLDFQDCNNALLMYSLTDDGLNNSIAISRAIPGSARSRHIRPPDLN
jgi:hypothetical protein